MTDRQTEAEARLRTMLARVFADGVLDEHERKELQGLYIEGGLLRNRVKEIFVEHLRKTHAAVMADGVVTDDEKRHLRAVIEGLKFPADLVPEEVKRALAY